LPPEKQELKSISELVGVSLAQVGGNPSGKRMDCRLEIYQTAEWDNHGGGKEGVHRSEPAQKKTK